MPSDALSLAEAIGQLICPTLHHGLVHDRPFDAARAAAELDAHGWGGYVVFHDEAARMAERIAALQARARVPLLIASDLEHGAGQQLHGLSTFPPAMAFGAAGDPALAEALGRLTAREALAHGVNWVFAPVADVTNNPLNPIINVRSFGGDPAAVAACVAAFVRGCEGAGALACAKHFPGHGDTETDSHSRLGRVGASRERLAAVEWVPFRAAIDAGVGSVMTAHLAVPALADEVTPATLSPAIMTGLLRGAWGYDGIVVTDALVMGGIVGGFEPTEAAVRAIAAGCDVVLMPPDPVAAARAIAEAVAAGRLPEARVRDAARRVVAAKARLAAAGAGQASAASTPAQAAAALAAEVARRALTLAKGPPGHQLPAGTFTLVVDDGAEPWRLAAFAALADARGLVTRLVVTSDADAATWAAVQAAAAAAPAVLVAVFSPIRIHKDRSLLPAALVGPLRALAAARPLTLLSLSSPFLVAQVPEAAAWVLTYGTHPAQLTAALDALTAGGPYPGRLPVVLPATLAAAPGRADEPPGRGPAFA